MIVRNVMQRKVVTANPEVNLRQASKVMVDFHIGSLVILDKNQLVGMLTSSDILKSIAGGADPESTLAGDVMSKKVVTIDPDKTIEDAVSLMLKNRIKKLPVTEGKKLVGIITTSDIISIEPKLIESIAGLVNVKLPGFRGG